ncbi:hypothetical protein FFLO_04338 [Filobasidium floriforme]|uniref:Uncharacterized protein n=1 Tax=Filobasidium floriforme TaxID=5210 RepID=A0A8K0JJE8_9TREE|nr:hypothetical protein FFLO_04338 [Filobasidium floriforme]
MRNPFVFLSTRSGGNYLPLPLDQQNKGPSTSSSSFLPNLTRRAWNILILACIALSTAGVYLWLSQGGNEAGPDLDLGMDVKDLGKEVHVPGNEVGSEGEVLEIDPGSGEDSELQEGSELALLSDEDVELDRVTLADLGQEAEDRYHLLGERMDEYLSTLDFFLRQSFPPHTSSLLIPALSAYTLPFGHPDSDKPGMLDFKMIHQTDKTYDPEDKRVKKWRDMHEANGWEWKFYNDEQALRWIEGKARWDAVGSVDPTEETQPETTIPTSTSTSIPDETTDKGFNLVELDSRAAPTASERGVMWAWEYMKRGVMRADFFRYLVVLLEGGVPFPTQTYPLRPIDEWGKIKPEIYDISSTDGPREDWVKVVETTEPSVVVAIDVDVHQLLDWGKSWPRPLGICQWTLSGAPHHPIYVDAVRRVVNATQYIAHQIEVVLPEEIVRLKDERPNGWKAQVKKMKKMIRTQQGILPIMEHTGPGLWSDSVFSYLLARYGITWHDLRALDHPMRIGEVLVLPITAFSPGGQPDFKAKGRDDEQADVVHDFRGSWKAGGL